MCESTCFSSGAKALLHEHGAHAGLVLDLAVAPLYHDIRGTHGGRSTLGSRRIPSLASEFIGRMCKLTHHAFDAVTIVHHVMAHGGFKHGVHAPGGAPLGACGHHRLAACRPDFHGSMSEITLWTIAAFSTFHEIFAKAAFVTTFLGPPRTPHTCHHAKGTWACVETRRLHGTNLTLRVGIDTIFTVLAFGQTFTHNGFKERIFLDFHLDSHHPVRVGFFPQFILT